MPFNQEAYARYLERAMIIAKDKEQKMGMMAYANPEDSNKKISKDLWDETIAFWGGLEADFPRMADALVPTGMNFRDVDNFIEQMFAAHGEFIDSTMRVMLYEKDLERYKIRYSGFRKTNRKTQEVTWPKPTVSGFPFTAENFIKAANYTEAKTKGGARADAETEEGRKSIAYIDFGVGKLKREINGKVDKFPNQQSLPGLFPNNQDNTINLMNEVDSTVADSVASIDYYARELTKCGFAKHIAEINRKSQVEQQALEEQETMQNQLKRIALGDVRPDDFYEFGNIAVYPVAGMHKK